MPKGVFERSDEHKKRIAEALRGIKRSDETKRKVSEAKKGKKFARSPEALASFREKMSGANNPNYGKPITEERRQKLRDANKFRATRLRKHGVTDEEYKTQREAGNRWCWFRKHFVAEDQINDRRGTCIACTSEANRKSDLAKKYNLTHEQYETMLAAQGGGCAICGSTDPGPRNKHMHIDHDHATGKVRGILCGPCNTAVERLESVPNWGLRAAQYLTSPLHQENGAASRSSSESGVAS